ncbi:MFS transporter [Amycolatopsis sp. NPDC059027]|uniref:MFS transporter n=1 Tax=unclassified Amycolatopsis TaxID=2618356 RepID=UPI0036700A54
MGYRGLAKKSILAWALVAIVARLPIAMAPLGLVFLVRDRAGGYSLGATLAAAYVVGEVVGALFIGTRPFSRRRGAISAGLGVGAVAFGLLALVPSAPDPLLVVLAGLAGAAPAASPGGMRTMLTRLVDESVVASALSAESTLTQAIWAVAPGLAVSLALWTGASSPMAVAAVCMAVAALTLLLLRGDGRAAETAAKPSARVSGHGRELLAAWPIYLTSAASMALLSAAELILTPLLEFRHFQTGWAGVLLTVFSVSSAAGAFVYGLRKWPGSVRAQSLVLLVAMSGCVALIAVAPGLAGIAVVLVIGGLCQAAVAVTRNLTLRESLPEPAHTAGYSVMYAVQGIGYTLTATLTALVLASFTPVTAVVGAAVLTLLLTVASALAELRTRRGTGSEREAELAAARAGTCEDGETA